MIQIPELRFSLSQVAGGENVLATDVRPIKSFVDGKPTDTISGYRYTIVAPQRKYQNFTVKVEQASPAITPEELEAKGGSVKCKIKGFEGRFYKDKNSNDYQFTAKAESVEVIS